MNIWEEIKSKVDIVDLISEYLPLTPSGNNFRARSPFKKEKTPSFIVSPQKQIWRDFSTGIGGDIFRFVMEMDNIDKAEALKKLAKKAGLEDKLGEQKEYTEEEKKIQKQKITLKEAGFKYLEWASKHFHKLLLKKLENHDDKVTQYCLKRGLTKEVIEQFQIGYAPPRGELLKVLEANKLNINLFIRVGILNNKNDKITEKFTDRLMIPIQDYQSQTVAFTGRVFPGESIDRPKYLNSPETEWFLKRRVWFGWNLSKVGIRQNKQVIVLEGNMDVITCFSKGLDFAIASQGTSFSNDHIEELINTTDSSMLNYLQGVEVLLAFDNDEAGQMASRKFFLEASQKGIIVKKIIVPPEFKDIDEYLNSFDKKEVEITDLTITNFVDDAIENNKYKLSSEDPYKVKESTDSLKELLSVLDPVIRSKYIDKISKASGVDTALLSQGITNSIQKTNTKKEVVEAKTDPKQELKQLFEHILCNSLDSSDDLAPMYNLLHEYLEIPQASISEYIGSNRKQLEMITEEHFETSSGEDMKHMLMTKMNALIDKSSHLFNTDNYLKYKQESSK